METRFQPDTTVAGAKLARPSATVRVPRLAEILIRVGISAQIPLYGRRGVVAYALVDATDAERLMRDRWNIHVSKGRIVAVKRARDSAYMHRVLMGAPPGLDVDHENHDTLDNRRANLRVTTRSQNQQNRAGATATSSTGIRGAYWDKEKRRFMAYVKIDGRQRCLGYFDTAEEAGRAAAIARGRFMTHAPESVGGPV